MKLAQCFYCGFGLRSVMGVGGGREQRWRHLAPHRHNQHWREPAAHLVCRILALNDKFFSIGFKIHLNPQVFLSKIIELN
jgi:hypothetical protein